MNVKIKDLMIERVITAQPHHTVDHLRGLMERNRIGAVPVVGPEGEAVGIVTTTDMVAALKVGTPVSQIMTERVYAVPAYNDAHIAARVMRKNKVHHVVVTHEKEVVGILSAFDLLQLVEDHRFTMKAGPDSRRRGAAKGGNRRPA
ncbi:MAG: CBS domain-containing protein [Pseudomonadota bacterium]